jgi:hypothetical protein
VPHTERYQAPNAAIASLVTNHVNIPSLVKRVSRAVPRLTRGAAAASGARVRAAYQAIRMECLMSHGGSGRSLERVCREGDGSEPTSRQSPVDCAWP